MTTPGEGAPDGAYVVGTPGEYGKTESQITSQWTNRVGGGFVGAQLSWQSMFFDPPFNQTADLSDGQNQIEGQVGLLEAASGYGTAVMGKNWKLPWDVWVDVPFTTQLGPTRYVDVESSGDRDGKLVLTEGGLWRIDLLMNGRGYIDVPRSGLAPSPGGGFPTLSRWDDGYSSIFVFRIVVEQNGSTISVREYKEPGVPYAAVGNAMNPVYKIAWMPMINQLRSSAFTFTFVADHEDGDCEVSVQVKVLARDDLGTDWFFGQGAYMEAAIFGGTKTSSLTATRWTPSAYDAAYDPNVPDGGTL